MEIKEKEQKIISLTNEFCDAYLNEEYFQLCMKLIKALGKKKEVPYKYGKLEIWAAAIVHALGTINFLFDKSFEPYISTKKLNEHFGTKNTTVSNKAKKIRDMFDMWHFNPEFSTQHMAKSNPFNKMVMVDGFIVPLETLPPELQEKVKEARANGGDIEFTTQ